MSVDEFVDLFVDLITVEAFITEDAYGRATYGPAVTIPGRVQKKDQMIFGATGQETLSTTQTFLSQRVGLKDQITLPADAAVRRPNILRVDAPRDDQGIHHYVVYT